MPGTNGAPGAKGDAGPTGADGSPIPCYLPCSEDITAGSFVNIWDDAGTAKIRKASWNTGYLADGYVLSAFLSGDQATFYQAGVNTMCAPGTPGQTAYIAATAGASSNAPPELRSGFWLQEIGKYLTTNSIYFAKGLTIQLR